MNVKEAEELTLRDIILAAQKYIGFLLKRWWVILLVGFFFAAIGAYVSYSTPITYNAQLTFMVNDDEGGSFGGIDAILGQFGVTGVGGNSKMNLDKIVALGTSRKIVERVLFDSTIVDGESDLVANHLISYLELRGLWEENDLLSKFRFRQRFNPKTATREEKVVLQVLYGRLVSNSGDELVKFGYHDKSGIVQLKTTAPKQDLSLALANGVYNQLSSYYISKTTEKQQNTFNTILFKSDSIRQALTQKEANLASSQDRSAGVVLSKERLYRNRLAREVNILTIMYGESVKNLETTRFILQNSMPVFQVIDRPLDPLSPQKPSIVIYTIAFAFLGGVLAALGVVFNEAYFELMEA